MNPLVTPKRSFRAVAGAGILLSAAIAAPLGARHAHAYGACRTDPIVVLSNGTVLDLSATIGLDVSQVSDITQISYTLHAPAGTVVARVVSTDGDVNYKEQFTLRTDSPAGVYGVQVQVQTAHLPQGMPQPVVVAQIEGGYASTLGVTPSMVGLKAWSATTTATVTDGKLPPPPPKPGPQLAQAVSSLPDDMTAQLASWAASAPWSAASGSGGQAGSAQMASITLM